MPHVEAQNHAIHVKALVNENLHLVNDNLHLLTGVIELTIYVSIALQVDFGRRRDVHSNFVHTTGPLIIHPSLANLSSIKSRGCTYRFFGKTRRVCLLPSMYKFLSCISWHSCACALVRRVHSHSLEGVQYGWYPMCARRRCRHRQYTPTPYPPPQRERQVVVKARVPPQNDRVIPSDHSAPAGYK